MKSSQQHHTHCKPISGVWEKVWCLGESMRYIDLIYFYEIQSTVKTFKTVFLCHKLIFMNTQIEQKTKVNHYPQKHP